VIVRELKSAEGTCGCEPGASGDITHPS